MDVVSALSRYRKSIFEDEVAHYILHIVYKDHHISSEEIRQATGIDKHEISRAIRELYQANFLIIGEGDKIYLTKFAENLLGALGANEPVAEQLVKETVSDNDSNWAANIVVRFQHAEPANSGVVVQSLRNLRSYFYSTDMPSDLTKSFAILCAEAAPGKNSLLVESFLLDEELQDNSELIKNFYDRASYIHEKSDLFLLNTCRSEAFLMPDLETNHLLSFRAFNYILSENRDVMIEHCSPLISGQQSLHFWGVIWKNIKPLWKIYSENIPEEDRNIENEEEFALLLTKYIKSKKKRESNLLEKYDVYVAFRGDGDQDKP